MHLAPALDVTNVAIYRFLGVTNLAIDKVLILVTLCCAT
jgi:hypothetical protein